MLVETYSIAATFISAPFWLWGAATGFAEGLPTAVITCGILAFVLVIPLGLTIRSMARVRGSRQTLAAWHVLMAQIYVIVAYLRITNRARLSVLAERRMRSHGLDWAAPIACVLVAVLFLLCSVYFARSQTARAWFDAKVAPPRQDTDP